MTDERTEKFLIWAGSNVTELLKKFEKEQDGELIERFLHIKNEILFTRRVLMRRQAEKETGCDLSQLCNRSLPDQPHWPTDNGMK